MASRLHSQPDRRRRLGRPDSHVLPRRYGRVPAHPGRRRLHLADLVPGRTRNRLLQSCPGTTRVSSSSRWTHSIGSPKSTALSTKAIRDLPVCWPRESSTILFGRPTARSWPSSSFTRNSGLSLYLSDRTTDDGPRYLLDSGPLWMSWSSDSGHLAVHRGGQHFLVAMDDDPKARSLWLEPSGGYRVPAWRPGHDDIAASSAVGGLVHGIYAVPVSPDDEKVSIKATAVEGQNAAFLWSSDGSYLAVADDAQPALYGRTPVLVYRGLRILDGESFKETARIDQHMLAFFWSPDGSRIAFAALRGRERGLGWTILDVEDRRRRGDGRLHTVPGPDDDVPVLRPVRLLASALVARQSLHRVRWHPA